ncbi:MAG: hypothetical protein JXO22_00310 [Phycisphaerae bacterium]|nr:hypothetical protein [Phycisphaerae bacterium]
MGGGFACGAVHELVGTSNATPVRSIALRTAALAAGQQNWVIYIDNANDCYPPGLAQLGIPLGRLLMIHASSATDTLWVCEQALRCSAIAAVIAAPRHLDTYVSRRLQLAAEAGGGLGLLLRPDAEHNKTFAASRIRFEPMAQDREVRQVLATVLKLREGSPSEPFVVELSDASGPVSTSAVPLDRSRAARRPSRAG